MTKSKWVHICKTAAWTVGLAASLIAPAKADVVFKIMNLSNVEAKGVVQNVQVLWLKRGQINDVRFAGDTRAAAVCGYNFETSRLDSNCPSKIPVEFTVNFENLGNAGDQYCVWQVKRRIGYIDIKNQRHGEFTHGPLMNIIQAKLTFNKPGFKCEVSGQLIVPPEQGMTVNFAVKSA